MFKDGSFMTFDQLIDEYDITRSHFFQVLTSTGFFMKYVASFPLLQADRWLDEWLEGDPHQKGMVSMLYSDIQEMASPSLDRIRESWCNDMGLEMPDDSWQMAIKIIHSSSVCIRHGLLQFKVFHRLHFSKSRLAEIYPDVDPTCSRCHQAPATLYHMFWSCPSLTQFWVSVFETFSYICDKEIGPNPFIAVFGVIPGEMTVSVLQSDAIAFSSLLARRLILFNWKSAIPPSHRRWVGDVMAHLKLEKLKYSTRGSAQKFYKVWQPFLDYFNEKFPAEDAQI